jgi:outer membrane protein assembly factor BamB
LKLYLKINPGGDGGVGRLRAHAPDTAALLWDFDPGYRFMPAFPPDEIFYASRLDENGSPVNLSSYSAQNAARKWTDDLAGYVSFNGRGYLFLSRRVPGKNRDNSISRLDVDTGKVLWTYDARTGRSFSSGLYGKKGEVYLAESDESFAPVRLVALDPETGKELWGYPLDGPFAVGADGTIYRLIQDDQGRVVGVEAISP